jgi:iron complex outermembrane recepter protein
MKRARSAKGHESQQRVAWAVASVLAGAVSTCYAAEPSAETLEEIVVTATRRAASVIDVPYNISAVSGETLEAAHIIDTVDLIRSVPALAVVDRGYRNSGVLNGIIIRGLNVNGSAQGDVALSTVPTVSTYVNDTPVYANFILKDIERVEVLRGPQGTLYGSGSLGGTVRYIMRAPRLGEFSGVVGLTGTKAEGSGGEGWAGDVTVNVPLGERLALRMTASRLDYPGIVDYPNVYVLDNEGLPLAPNGLEDPAASYRSVKDADTVEINYGRLALLWEPNDVWRVLLSGQIQEDEIGGRRQETVGSDGFGRRYRDFENGSIQLEPSDKNVALGALEVEVDLGFATLTSSSSYYDHEGNSISENTGFYAQNAWLSSFYYNYPRPMASAARGYQEKAFVQELRLVSQGENALDYVVGAFYLDQNQISTQTSYLRGFKRWWDVFAPGFEDVVISDVDFDYRRDQTVEEKSLFGELTWHVSDSLHVTGGLRYFDSRFDNDSFMAVSPYAGFNEPLFPQFSDQDDDVLYKFNVAWELGEDRTLYGTVSQGYRRGGTNAIPTTGNFAEDPAFQTYQSDSVTNYEVGMKGRIGPAAQYSAAVFYLDWEDIQLDTATPVWGFFDVVNGESAGSQGLELEINGRAGDFTYGLGYTYVDAQLTAPLCSPAVTRAVCISNPGDPTLQLARDGAQLPGAAEHTINVMLEHTLSLGGTWQWRNRISGYYQSETENSIGYSARVAQTIDGFQLWNFNSTVSQGSWDFTVFIKNIANEEGVTGLFTEAHMGTNPSEGYFGNGSKQFLSQPRTIGVAVNFSF